MLKQLGMFGKPADSVSRVKDFSYISDKLEDCVSCRASPEPGLETTAGNPVLDEDDIGATLKDRIPFLEIQ